MDGSRHRDLSTSSTLLRRLRNWDDHQSWEEFYSGYRKLIYGFARRQGLADQAAQDVVQDTLLSVAKALHSFRYDADRSSFKHWLWRLTRNRVVDHVRRLPRELPLSRGNKTQTQRTGTVERVADPASLGSQDQYQAEWEEALLKAALEKLKRQVKPRHYQIFDLLVLQQQTPARVAKALGVSLPQVYLVRHRVARQLGAMVKGLEQGLG